MPAAPPAPLTTDVISTTHMQLNANAVLSGIEVSGLPAEPLDRLATEAAARSEEGAGADTGAGAAGDDADGAYKENKLVLAVGQLGKAAETMGGLRVQVMSLTSQVRLSLSLPSSLFILNSLFALN